VAAGTRAGVRAEPDPRSPLVGWTDVRLDTIAPVSLLYSPASRDTTMPGVLAVYDPGRRSPLLLLGGRGRDAGVFFLVTEVSDSGFNGRWRDGGLRVPGPEGVFCAVRVIDSN
jgi:hypothetical protein